MNLDVEWAAIGFRKSLVARRFPPIQIRRRAATLSASLTIVIAQLRDQDLIARLFVNDPMLGGDSARPVALQRVPERLGLADTGGGMTHDLFDEEIDSRNHLGIRLLPVEIVVPGLRRENEIHAPSLILRLIPLPRFKVSTAVSNRLAFAGERSR